MADLILRIFGTVLFVSAMIATPFFLSEFTGVDWWLALIGGELAGAIPTFFVWYGYYLKNR